MARATYATFSIVAWAAWSVVLGIVALTHHQKLYTFAILFGGWVIGWTSATIARAVYPPPKPGHHEADR